MAGFPALAPAPEATVVLIHGLWMRTPVMLPHARWLAAEGFASRRFAYASWRGSLADNAARLARCVAATPGKRIDLVAHSLGGLVALTMLAQHADPRIGRVVLLGTPYASCHCGFACASLPLLSRCVGRSFTDWFARPRPEPPPGVAVGVIAGTRSISWGRLIPGLERPNDGLIAVSETRLPGAADSIALKVSHSGMLVSRACARQIVSFLKTGRFDHG